VLNPVETRYCDDAIRYPISGTILTSARADKRSGGHGRHPARDPHRCSLNFGRYEQAVDAARQYRFRAGMRNGQPVPVYTTIEVEFVFGQIR
jgi:hypothetical protein